MSKISPLAFVDPKACVADDVEIGPFCVISGQSIIGPGCKLLNNVTFLGQVKVGRNNTFYPNVVVGGPPQDRGYKGEPTGVEMGNDNVIREAATIRRGTAKGGGVSRLGNNNLLMVNTHLGHDVQVADNCELANNVMVGGHCILGTQVIMAGGVGVNHFVTVGDYSFVGGYSRIHHDVPPFCKVDGADLVRGPNIKGLRRAGFTDEDIEAIEEAYKLIFYREQAFARAIAQFDTMNGINRHVKGLVEFLRRRDLGRHGRYQESLRAK